MVVSDKRWKLRKIFLRMILHFQYPKRVGTVYIGFLHQRNKTDMDSSRRRIRRRVTNRSFFLSLRNGEVPFELDYVIEFVRHILYEPEKPYFYTSELLRWGGKRQRGVPLTVHYPFPSRHTGTPP